MQATSLSEFRNNLYEILLNRTTELKEFKFSKSYKGFVLKKNTQLDVKIILDL